jgi:hypothetical protein
LRRSVGLASIARRRAVPALLGFASHGALIPG